MLDRVRARAGGGAACDRAGEDEETPTAIEGTKHAEPVQVRDHLVEVLGRDLVEAEPHEVLSVAPSRGYLPGFLIPRAAPIEVGEDPDPDEALASAGDEDGDDAAPPEVASARQAFFPSRSG